MPFCGRKKFYCYAHLSLEQVLSLALQIEKDVIRILMSASFPTIIETVHGVYYVQPHIGFPVQFHHNNNSCRQDGWSVLLFQDYYCYDV